ncbi:MAG: hypothetical protein PHW77_03680 [Eubacteriales bacterium]|nr:hypothetical protein [Eubacteriales bacterium]
MDKKLNDFMTTLTDEQIVRLGESNIDTDYRINSETKKRIFNSSAKKSGVIHGNTNINNKWQRIKPNYILKLTAAIVCLCIAISVVLMIPVPQSGNEAGVSYIESDETDISDTLSTEKIYSPSLIGVYKGDISFNIPAFSDSFPTSYQLKYSYSNESSNETQHELAQLYNVETPYIDIFGYTPQTGRVFVRIVYNRRYIYIAPKEGDESDVEDAGMNLAETACWFEIDPDKGIIPIPVDQDEVAQESLHIPKPSERGIKWSISRYTDENMAEKYCLTVCDAEGNILYQEEGSTNNNCHCLFANDKYVFVNYKFYTKGKDTISEIFMIDIKDGSRKEIKTLGKYNNVDISNLKDGVLYCQADSSILTYDINNDTVNILFSPGHYIKVLCYYDDSFLVASRKKLYLVKDNGCFSINIPVTEEFSAFLDSTEYIFVSLKHENEKVYFICNVEYNNGNSYYETHANVNVNGLLCVYDFSDGSVKIICYAEKYLKTAALVNGYWYCLFSNYIIENSNKDGFTYDEGLIVTIKAIE